MKALSLDVNLQHNLLLGFATGDLSLGVCRGGVVNAPLTVFSLLLLNTSFLTGVIN